MKKTFKKIIAAILLISLISGLFGTAFAESLSVRGTGGLSAGAGFFDPEDGEEKEDGEAMPEAEDPEVAEEADP